MQSARTNSPAAARRAFSLVELLVVIAVMAVLLGILLPALSGSRNAARVASTRALMNTIDTAVKSFRTEHGRLPGVFTPQELADTRNSSPTNYSLTYMENALLELAGGVVGEEEDGAFWMTFTNLSTTVQHPQWIKPSLMGAEDGPGYLNVGDALRPVYGQLGQMNSGAIHPRRAIPDIIDPFGQPIMMWAINEYAGRKPDTVFATASPNQNAHFYWGPNGSYTNSPNLGKGRISQETRSLLSRDEFDDFERRDTVQAICGNPALANQVSDSIDKDFGPAAPRGEIVLHSAGVDQIFLSRGRAKSGGGEGPLRKAEYTGGITSADLLRAAEIDVNDDTWAPIESFDDIIVGGG